MLIQQTRKVFFRILVAEIVIIILVPVLFSFISEKRLAGLIAGVGFVLLGGFIAISGARSEPLRKSVTFKIGAVHLFASALPMLIIRFLNWDAEFQNLTILGIPGPIFHKVATALYVGLVIVTAIDFFRITRKTVEKNTGSNLHA